MKQVLKNKIELQDHNTDFDEYEFGRAIFAKTDISDIVSGSKEEADAIWANTRVKAIGSINPNIASNSE